jgi:hypothetical protein
MVRSLYEKVYPMCLCRLSSNIERNRSRNPVREIAYFYWPKEAGK